MELEEVGRGPYPHPDYYRPTHVIRSIYYSDDIDRYKRNTYLNNLINF